MIPAIRRKIDRGNDFTAERISPAGHGQRERGRADLGSKNYDAVAWRAFSSIAR